VRRAAQRDAVEAAVIQALRSVGWDFLRISDTGIMDGLAVRAGCIIPMEVKSPGGVLEPAQRVTFERLERAGVLVPIVTSGIEAQQIVAALEFKSNFERAELCRNPKACRDIGLRTWRDLSVDDAAKPGRKSRPKLRLPKHLR
jgi:hypothetical protein